MDTVLAELDAQLAPAGLRLRRVHGEVLIRAVEPGLTAGTTREVWRRHLARRSLDVGQARLLRRAVQNEVMRAMSEDERLRGASMVNAGILARTPSGGLMPAQDSAFSFVVST